MILLDTQIIVWYLTDDPRLTEYMKQQLEDHSLLYSSASVYEILMLVSRGTFSFPQELLLEWLRQAGFREVQISSQIMSLCHSLEFKYRDPWDRIIASTAYSLGCRLMTTDAKLMELGWLDLVPTSPKR